MASAAAISAAAMAKVVRMPDATASGCAIAMSDVVEAARLRGDWLKGTAICAKAAMLRLSRFLVI